MDQLAIILTARHLFQQFYEGMPGEAACITHARRALRKHLSKLRITKLRP